MSSFLEIVNAFDWIALAIFGLFITIGVFKGAAWQAMRLVMILVAMIAAKLLTPAVAHNLELTFSGLRDNVAAFYIGYFMSLAGVIFIGVLLMVLAGKLMTTKVKLKRRDRLVGGFAGLLTGITLIIIAVLFMTTVVPENENGFWNVFGETTSVKCSSWVVTNGHIFFPPALRYKASVVIGGENVVAESEHGEMAKNDEEPLPPPQE